MSNIKRPVYAYGDGHDWQLMDQSGHRFSKARVIHEAAVCINLCPRALQLLRRLYEYHGCGDESCPECMDASALLAQWDLERELGNTMETPFEGTE